MTTNAATSAGAVTLRSAGIAAVLWACAGGPPGDRGAALGPGEKSPFAVVPTGARAAATTDRELIRGKVRGPGGVAALEATEPGSTPEENLLYGLARERLGRPAEARPYLAAALAAEPESVPALLGLARVELAEGAVGAAERLLRRADEVLQRHGRSHPDLPLLLGRCRLRGDDPESGVRLLRQELVDGARPGAAALYLADHLGRHGRLAEALAMLDAGLGRARGRLDLSLARARVLMDMGRYHEAARALGELAARVPHPRVLWMAASAARALGDGEAARQHLRKLRESFADHPWMQAHRAAVDDFELGLASAQPGAPTYTSRELLAIVRSSPNVVLRVRALRTLAAAPAEEFAAALRIARTDSEHLLRLNALRLGFSLAAAPDAWIRSGLSDSAPAVRGAAARLAVNLPRREAIPLLLSFLDAEQDGYVVGQMHEAFSELSGEHAGLPRPEALDSEERDRVRSFWRQRWAR